MKLTKLQISNKIEKLLKDKNLFHYKISFKNSNLEIEIFNNYGIRIEEYRIDKYWIEQHIPYAIDKTYIELMQKVTGYKLDDNIFMRCPEYEIYIPEKSKYFFIETICSNCKKYGICNYKIDSKIFKKEIKND